jgi:hypothetical protein
VKQAGGSLGAALEQAAEALEGCLLADLAGDLDRMLAALDFEPLAAEFDAVIQTAMNKGLAIITDQGEALRDVGERLQAMIEQFNPGAQAQKFLGVFDVLRAQLDIMNPRRLAGELAEIHNAIRQIVAAYDPAIFAEELHQTLVSLATGLRQLDPATLLGDLSLFDDTLARVEAALPSNALAGIGESLAELGEELSALDPAGLLVSVEEVGPELIDTFKQATDDIRNEIVALLKAIKFATAGASVSVEVSVGGS